MALQEAGGERIAVKLTCAADLLQNISTQLAKDLEASERKVARYICQVKILLSWKQGHAAVRIVGTTVKTVGLVAVLASSINPKLRMAVTVGDKMWKLGTGLKLLSYIADILRDMWQKGCRDSFIDFMHHTSMLVRNVRVLEELVNDVRKTVCSMRDSHQLDTAEQIWNVVSSSIPDKQSIYIRHIICLVVSSPSYSPLFDFAGLITDPPSDANVIRVMREIESIKFLDFVQENDSKTLVAIGSFLHVTRELVDFFDSFRQLKDGDCIFVKQCLTRFAEESKKIKSVVSFLKSLNAMKAEFQGMNLKEADISISNGSDVVSDQQITRTNGPESTPCSSSSGGNYDKINE